MGFPIYGARFLILATHILLLALLDSSNSVQINSNSVLVALLDSHYTVLAELVEKALLLQTLEQAVGNHNVTIFAPNNYALERELDPQFKRFLLEPGNLKSLQELILFHIIPVRLNSDDWPSHSSESTLSNGNLSFTLEKSGQRLVGLSKVTHPDFITRPDGIIHGIQRLLIPPSVENEFNRRRSLRAISAVKPEGAPKVDPRTRPLKNPSPPALPIIFDAMAPGPSLAPAPAPGPGGAQHHFDGEAQVKDFIATLMQYGGYNELADILVNLTSLASEMGRLVSEGYVLTVLAPNDEAMAKLSAEQLSEAGAPEQIMYYHLIPEYQTEESMYNGVRRFGKVNYDTLRVPHKVVAQEADGSVKFGRGEGAAYLFDPDIYTDGRISVQGIDGVLVPEEEEEVVAKKRRGILAQVTCLVLRGMSMGQDSRITTCH
ncbi:fasciclin-like arabinogalactan protein 17 [Euphorbia lathyris]|uniref:fasciclin-like arabinogalactan protein 17 n=1 Tax=Euphorbia lathyris TaxID=212925 RepID=UPI003313D16D